MQLNKSILTATLLAAASLTANAAPNPATADFKVKLTVNSICTVKTGTADILLGNVDAGTAALAANIKTGNTVLTVNCSKGTAYNIGLKSATLGATDTGTGSMKGPGAAGTETVGYKLTKDAAGLSAWGNAGMDRVSGTGALYATNIVNTVYATVTTSADVAPGDYTDTVNVQVTY